MFAGPECHDSAHLSPSTPSRKAADEARIFSLSPPSGVLAGDRAAAAHQPMDGAILAGDGLGGGARSAASGAAAPPAQYVTTLAARITARTIARLVAHRPLFARYVRSGAPFVWLHGRAIGAVGLVQRAARENARGARGGGGGGGGKSLLDSCRVDALPPDAAARSIARAAWALKHARAPEAALRALFLVHAAALAEAARRRLGALALEAAESGLGAIAAALAAWLPANAIPYERRVRVAPAAAVAQAAAAAAGGEPPSAPSPTLCEWPLPWIVRDTLGEAAERGGYEQLPEISATCLAARYALSAESRGGDNFASSAPALAHALATFVVHGVLRTPFGLRLTHPAAVFEYAILVAKEGLL
jgi:hypothetical protein